LQHNIDLSAVAGSGERGRVTRDDVLRAAGLDPGREGEPRAQPAITPAPPAVQPSASGPPSEPTAESISSDAHAVADMMNAQACVPPLPGVGYRSYKLPPYAPKEGDQVVAFSRRRRLTADHMVYSKHVSPQVVTVAEIDVHKTLGLREQHKQAYKSEGVSLTMMAFISSAVVRALREFPIMNARVLQDSYVMLRDIHLGVAVDTPEGLVVPNIKRADELSLRGLAKTIEQLAIKAREGKLTPDDLSGGTFSVSNPGAKGNLFGAAVISQPNVGIVRTGEIKKRPVVVECETGDSIAIHEVMFAALSYDHRVVDGVAANAFLWRVAQILQTAEFSP